MKLRLKLYNVYQLVHRKWKKYVNFLNVFYNILIYMVLKLYKSLGKHRVEMYELYRYTGRQERQRKEGVNVIYLLMTRALLQDLCG